MSAICSFISIYSSLMFFFVTYSLRKWNLMGICFVLECITGFVDMFIALVLSQSIGIGSSYFTWISSNVCFIQITCVQHAAAAMYSASAVDKDTDDCFLLDQGECLMAYVFWKDEHETNLRRSWRCYEDDLEENWRQRWMQRLRFFHWYLNSDEEFQCSIVEFVMESLKFIIFSKDKIEMHMDLQLITLNARKNTCL